MSYSNNIITAPVSIYDVKAALGVSSNDLGTLCRSEQINRWSKYKPYNYNSLRPSFRPSDSGTRQKLIDKMYGLTIPQFYNFEALINGVLNGGGKWEYTDKPQGGATSPYRLTDFEGYQNSSSAWGLVNDKWDLVLGGSIVLDRGCYDDMIIGNGAIVSFRIENDIDGELGYGENLLKLMDFYDRASGFDDYFRNFYGGILFYDSSRSRYITYIDTLPLYNANGIDDMQKYRGVDIFTKIPSSTQQSSFVSGQYLVVPFILQPFNDMEYYKGQWVTSTFQSNPTNNRRIIAINGAHFNVRLSTEGATPYIGKNLTITASVTQVGNTLQITLSYVNNTGVEFVFKKNNDHFGIPEAYVLAQSENSYDNGYVMNDWETGWIYNEDNLRNKAPNGVLYTTQIWTNACYERSTDGSLSDIYARTAQVTKMDGTALTSIPNGSGTLGKCTINGTGDSYGSFTVGYSYYICVEFEPNSVNQSVSKRMVISI